MTNEKCLDNLIFEIADRELDPQVDAEAISQIEAASVDGNPICSVLECQIPECNRESAFNMADGHFDIITEATRGVCEIHRRAAAWQIKFALSSGPHSPLEATRNK